ncbi:MAG TPA: lipopolysaccharide transport periplasmic protein LptA [Steroidobacteraceae bacterium]|jgi:lipopolysaccharide transport protein LptA|nr:lipopolysaccharide transport periplasmic protein LptA [Steroidobacteraceae bacterium]
MAALSPERRRTGSLLRRYAIATAALSLLCVAGPGEGAGPQRSNLPINVDAQSSDFDYAKNTLLFRKVRVSQGDTSVEADEATATGLNFENSKWEFHSNVKIQVEGGSLKSDEASVTFADNQISRALITGSPAEFEQKLENSEDIAHGRAGSIEYDFTSETIRMLQDAYLTDGHNDIRGQTLVYSIREQRVLANASDQGDERVRITINPRNVQGKPATTDRPR